MRKHFFLLFFLCLQTFAFCQYGGWQWVKSLGKSYEPYGKDGSKVVMDRDAEENLYVAAPFSGVLTLGSYSFTSKSKLDYVLTKYDKDGALIWAKHLYMRFADNFLNIEDLDIAGANIILIGNYYGQLGFDLPFSIDYNYGSFVASFDASTANLNYLGKKRRLISEKGFMAGCFNPKDNLVYICGDITNYFVSSYDPAINYFFPYSQGIVSNTSVLPTSIEVLQDAIIVGGRLKGSLTFNCGGYITSNGGFLVSLKTDRSNNLAICNWSSATPTPITSLALTTDGFLTSSMVDDQTSTLSKYTASGTLVWAKMQRGQIDAVSVDGATGAIYSTGGFNYNIWTGSTTLLRNSSPFDNRNQFVAKHNSDGVMIDAYQVDLSNSNASLKAGDVIGVGNKIYATGNTLYGTATFNGVTIGNTGGIGTGYFANIHEALKIITPNGGEQLVGGRNCPITWDGYANSIHLDYTVDNGNTWIPIANDISAITTRSYNWVVPKINASTAQIRIRSVSDPMNKDQSNKPFSIIAPSIILTSPNGGEIFSGATNPEVRWTVNYPANKVNIYFSTDGGATWSVSVRSANASSATGSYVYNYWEVPNVNSTTCRIKVEDEIDPSVADISDNNFTIRPVFRVTEPTVSSYWPDKSNVRVGWEDYASGATYNIDYHSGNGLWKRLVSGVNGSCAFVNVPNQTCDFYTNQAYVRVVRASNGEAAISHPFELVDGPDPDSDCDMDFYSKSTTTTAVVFPNPVKKGGSKITLSDSLLPEGKQVRVRIYALNAPQQQLQEQVVLVQGGKLSVQVSSLQPGVYTLAVHTDTQTIRRKFSKE